MIIYVDPAARIESHNVAYRIPGRSLTDHGVEQLIAPAARQPQSLAPLEPWPGRGICHPVARHPCLRRLGWK